ncbi:MAG: hypothetical protein OEY59_00875 [Deltaproteobacteria bacterium]|nr:hypothetical protein [Deltaproteobacteria bacterium]
MKQFTPEAEDIWEKLDSHEQQDIISSFICQNCGDVPVESFSGVLQLGKLILNGKCECGEPALKEFYLKI